MEQQFETKKFTEPAVLFALTGHVFMREDASLEYYQTCLHEIHEDLLYRFVMSSVPPHILAATQENIGADEYDVDPILASFLCSENPTLAAIKEYSDKTPYPKSKKLIEGKLLTNGYIEVSTIDFMSFSQGADESAKKHQKLY